MENCLWCHHNLNHVLTWTDLFLWKQPEAICDGCQQQLAIIKGPVCKKCSRPSKNHICSDCEFWNDYYGGEDPLVKNISIYQYNSFMKDMITKWKYRGDYQLGNIFKTTFLHVYKEKIVPLTNRAIIMAIPLSNERAADRAFNQAEMLASFIGSTSEYGLTRIDGEKQSKKSRKSRIASKNPFYLHLPINKPVILVDDIYTTGRTVRHAAARLKANGCPEVYAYTLIRG